MRDVTCRISVVIALVALPLVAAAAALGFVVLGATRDRAVGEVDDQRTGARCHGSKLARQTEWPATIDLLSSLAYRRVLEDAMEPP